VQKTECKKKPHLHLLLICFYVGPAQTAETDQMGVGGWALMPSGTDL